MTPLHFACLSGNMAISKMLLEEGADIRAKSTELMTPLHTAVYNGNSSVASLILRTGELKKQALCDVDTQKGMAHLNRDTFNSLV